jgi:hypothetical protein
MGAPSMGEHNGGNDDRGLKARNRRWDRIPKTYYIIADIDLIARHIAVEENEGNGVASTFNI